jgi:Flp pilus assembly protein TadG
MKSLKSVKRFQAYGKMGPVRSGATAVEFALTAPVLFLLLFGALELGHANMVLNTTEAACYEGARVGIVPGTTAAECIAATQRLLDIAKIKDATITVTPANLATQTEAVTIRVVVPYRTNAVTVPFFTRGLTIQRECKLTRESA